VASLFGGCLNVFGTFIITNQEATSLQLSRYFPPFFHVPMLLFFDFLEFTSGDIQTLCKIPLKGNNNAGHEPLTGFFMQLEGIGNMIRHKFINKRVIE